MGDEEQPEFLEPCCNCVADRKIKLAVRHEPEPLFRIDDEDAVRPERAERLRRSTVHGRSRIDGAATTSLQDFGLGGATTRAEIPAEVPDVPAGTAALVRKRRPSRG